MTAKPRFQPSPPLRNGRRRRSVVAPNDATAPNDVRPVRMNQLRHRSWIYTLPILYKVLIANAIIIIAGAILGTTTTFLTFLARDDRLGITLLTLIVGFVVVGFPVTMVVNYAVLRAAFRPIDVLQRTADAVAAGDLTARAEETRFIDPQIHRLSATFNATLDEIARDRQEIDALASAVIRAQEDERKRIARELHDDTAQLLFAQLLTIATLKSSVSGPNQPVVESLEDATVQSLESVRRLALELRPPALDDLGLYDALAALCTRTTELTGIPVRFSHRGARARLPRELELILYRVVQEALTNISKHAQAQHGWVTLDRGRGDVTISIRDDGIGFERHAAQATDGRGLGLGIFGMEERVALAGGSFRIWRRGEHGTEVFAMLPIGDGSHATQVRSSLRASRGALFGPRGVPDLASHHPEHIDRGTTGSPWSHEPFPAAD